MVFLQDLEVMGSTGEWGNRIGVTGQVQDHNKLKKAERFCSAHCCATTNMPLRIVNEWHVEVEAREKS